MNHGQQHLFMRGSLCFAKKAAAASTDWKTRYYVLRALEGNLVGCEQEKDAPAHPVAVIQLYQAKVSILPTTQLHQTLQSSTDLFPLTIEPANGKSWFLAARSSHDRDDWISALEEAIKIAPSETESERHKQIDKLIMQEKKLLSKCPEMKLLLLGPGHSGKSTILKQMKILHCNGFAQEELEFFKGLCRSNVLDSMKQLLDASQSLGLKLGPESSALAKTFQEYFQMVYSRANPETGGYTNSEDIDDHDTKTEKTERPTSYGELASFSQPRSTVHVSTGKSIEIPKNVVECIKGLWKDDLLREDTVAKGCEFNLPDSLVYFLDEVDRISQDDFVPNPQDVLRSRYRTTGVHETVFSLDNAKFRIIDVGGQRGERKKWISFFEDVTAVLFVAAISEYQT